MTVNVKTLIISALAMATGASFGGAAYESLALQTNNFFSATVGASAITLDQATWSLPTGYTWAYETVGGMTCAEINTELNAPVTLQSNEANSSNPIKMMAFDLIASTVPVGTEISAPDGKTPAYGFAIRAVQGTGDNANRQYTNFYAKVGSPLAWVKLSGDVPTENTAYKLTVIEDARAGFGQVQFRVKIGNGAETILEDATNASTTWFSVTSRTNLQQVNIDLYGTGYFHMIDGDDIAVLAEALPIPGGGGTMTVSEQAASAFESQATSAGQTTAQYMAETNETNGKSNLDNYILFGKSEASTVTAADKVVLAGDAVTTTENSFAVKAPKINVPGEFQSKVTWTVEGSTDGNNWSTVSGITPDVNGAFTVPFSKVGTGSGQYLYFRAKASITYADQQN